MNVLFMIYSRESNLEFLGTSYLSAIVKGKGHKTFLVDVAREKNVIDKVRRISPEIVSYSISMFEARRMIEINRQLKLQLNFISVFGGPHPTFYPEIIEEDGVDIICRGEGDGAFGDLISCIDEGKDYSSIKNLWVKKETKHIIKNEFRPFCQDLDSIPSPDRALFDGIPSMKKLKYRSFFAGRGCPHKCSFCFNHATRRFAPGRYIRLRSVDNLLQEIESVLVRYPFECVFFWDGTFGYDLEWLKEFCVEYPKRIKLPFIINIRPNYLDEERVSLLAKAGCRCVAMGIETGNDELRNSVLKKNLQSKDILRAGKLLHKYKMKFITQNMIGIPGETIETVLDTISINIKCNPTTVNLFFFTPFPKLNLTRIAVEQGLLSVEDVVVPDSMFNTIALALPDKDDIQFLGCMIFTLVEIPWLFHLARFTFRQRNNRIRHAGKLILLYLDRLLQKFPNRRTNKRFVAYDRYWK